VRWEQLAHTGPVAPDWALGAWINEPPRRPSGGTGKSMLLRALNGFDPEAATTVPALPRAMAARAIHFEPEVPRWKP